MSIKSPSPSDVGRWLGIRPSSVVLLVDELVDRGHLQRSRNPENRRQTVLQLTPSGTRIARRVSELTATLDQEFVSHVHPSDRRSFETALRAIAAANGIAGHSD